ncbi:hypothetical protein MML48_3g00015908 [Holotrichia oblita]|uniref:Uncharacterized protein n=1 Tax=Holotrichia oblita TaxID=644536 RepID=A0ACB9TBH8_HOLOL|nr:hypothetical protein MML48_3g00015908 [Holotrichia oblita]
MYNSKKLVLQLLVLVFYFNKNVICIDNNSNIFISCSAQKSFTPCLAGRFSEILDKAVDHDLTIFDGFVLRRDKNVTINNTPNNGRSFNGFSRLKRSLYNYLDSHILRLDISESRKSKDGGVGYGGFAKVGKRNRKYLYYALLAVTGIFGLSVPMILKGLSLVAGKALLASKAALIIIGSIALKKIFQSDKGDSASPVKVHTHTVPIDEHDRYFDTSGYHYNRLQQF